jgi:hypothetical protein
MYTPRDKAINVGVVGCCSAAFGAVAAVKSGCFIGQIHGVFVVLFSASS